VRGTTAVGVAGMQAARSVNIRKANVILLIALSYSKRIKLYPGIRLTSLLIHQFGWNHSL
jgi:hypothetical protein